MNFSFLRDKIVNAGVLPEYPPGKSKAIRLSNFIAANAILNTLGFVLIFLYLNDFHLMKVASVILVSYVVIQSLSFLGFSTISRIFFYIAGNLIIFYISCIFRGESNLQLFFLSILMSGFLHFGWEERHLYSLIVLPIVLYLLGDYYQWEFFEKYDAGFNMVAVRTFANFATMIQIAVGVIYFLKQSVKFEAESRDNFDKLQEEYKRQIQVQKMSSLGEMAAGVAHEINNPLTVIMASIFLARRNAKEPEVVAMLEKIEHMAKRVSRIVTSLKRFSRQTENDPWRKVKVKDLVSGTLDLCSEKIRLSGINLELNTPDDLYISCNDVEISQVLINLITNAVDALEVAPRKNLLISAAPIDANRVSIDVVDSGAGIAPEIFDKVLQPFFTTKDVGKGTGLGLSVSKGIVEKHGGKLEFSSSKGQTSFKVNLPAAI